MMPKGNRWPTVYRIIIAGITVLAAILSSDRCTAADGALLEPISKQCSINWTTNTIGAFGQALAQKNRRGEFLECEKALSEAVRDAHNHLLAGVKLVRINHRETVGDFAEKDDMVMARLMDMVKDTDVIKQRYSTDGTVTVFVRLKFSGGFSQLVLPKEIEHVASIISLKNTKDRKPDADQDTATVSTTTDPAFSGLVVDARGLDMRPVLSPRILDENRQEIYGPAFISREIAVQNGICGYAEGMAVAKADERVQANPLVVRAILTVQHDRSGLVISNADALKIKGASANLAFLRQCRVIIVVDAFAGRTGA